MGGESGTGPLELSGGSMIWGGLRFELVLSIAFHFDIQSYQSCNS